MKKVATFEKVSENQYIKDGGIGYENIILPKRATLGSAGYDFFAPQEITVLPRGEFAVKSGVRCKIKKGFVLMIFPKSGLGTKFGLALKNTVGIIDSDYFDADNEGHIIIHLVNNGDKQVDIPAGKAFVQGIFLPYGITEEDEVFAKRKGGFGSTEK